MKKAIALTLALVMALALLSGCGGTAPGATSPADSTPADSTQAVEDPAPIAASPADAKPDDSPLPASPADAQGEGFAARIIIDEAGNEVKIPKEINRVAITSVTPLPALFALFMGSAEKLVGIHPSSKNTAMHSIVAELVPDIADVPTSCYVGSERNAEALIKLEPDGVVYCAGRE
ncbi:MAG: hypothetical protein IK136_03225, partial [Oscillospiraceae bacterium]|nr:hypothetical protein [Oscillospiraceae bacterium]